MIAIEQSASRARTSSQLMILALAIMMMLAGTAIPASAAPRVGTVAVAAQSGILTAGTAGSATYQVTVTNGDGKNVTAGLSVTAGLPVGATASFNPSSLPFATAPPGTQMTSTLTITTNVTTPAQTAVPFTVQAVRTNGGNGSDNATGDGALTIGVAPGLTPQTITFGPLPDKVFGDPDFTVSATGGGSGNPVTFAATGDCTIAIDLVHITSAGSCTITASQAGNATYDPAPDVQQTFAIANEGQIITFDPLDDKAENDPDFTVSATASSGLDVTFAAAGPCTVTVDSVSLTGPGMCTIFASQSGNASYAPAPDVQQTFVILPTGGADATFDLYAVTGSAVLPAATVDVWGYNTSNTGVTQPGGPTLVVDEGDVVMVTLNNTLSEASSLLFGGQSMVPDTSGAAPGGTRSYLFTADNPGTYLYEAGLVPNGQHQVAMGLYGALVVRPTAGAPLTGTSTEEDPSYSATVLVDTPADYYRLGEATGTTAVDEVGTSDGIYGSTVALAAPGLLDNSTNTAASFDGTADSYVDTGVTSLANDAFSVEAWVNADVIGITGYRIVSKDEVGVTGAWIVWINAGKLRFQVRNSTDTAWAIAEAPTTPSVGQTFHVVGVFDGTDAILYVDGVEVARVALGTATTNTNGLPVTIGADSDPTNPRDHIFDGTIDEVAIYDAALSDTQIQDHFAAAYAPVGMTLTDSTANFGVDLVGGTLSNTFDGSSCPIASVTPTTLTCSSPLSGGTANAWATGDDYSATGPATAYSDPATAYDDEAVLVLSEIDPSLNNAPDPAAFDMREFEPKYFLINGEVYPDTAAIATTAGNRVLLRYVNAGTQYHSMALLGAHQTMVAFDGSPLAYSRRFVAETFGPGQTADAIVSVPATTTDGTKWAIYDGSLLLHNSNQGGFGGMLTFLDVSGIPGGSDVTGPVTSNIAYSAATLTATVSDSNTGGSAVGAAEYYLDSTAGTAIAMSATDGTFDSVIEGVTVGAIIPSGSHTLFVRGQDAVGNWGAFNSVLVNGGDATGPITKSPALVPNPSNGTADVALHATGDDTTTGGSTISAAEYFIGTDPGEGSAVAMTVNNPATIASLDATIPAATVDPLGEGAHIVSIRSMDSSGNWGALVTIDLLVDKTGPATTVLSANPNPNNGTLPFNPSTQAVRVSADLVDTVTGSNITAAEGFIDTVGTTGSGFVFVASDGSFNSSSETGFADIPLTTVVQLGEGVHTIHVHSKDAAGNWGPYGTIDLVIDKTAPAVSIVSAAPNPTGGASPVTLTATATDSTSDITAAEWFTGTDPGVGKGTTMTVTGPSPWNLSATIDVSTWANGSFTLNMRARDAAGNWSPLGSTSLVVDAPPPPFPGLSFSTATNFAVGALGAPDDADIYHWDGAAFSRPFDASVAGLPANADMDAVLVVDADTFYMSFDAPLTIGTLGTVDDSDVVLYDGGVWTVYFDGSDVGLTTNNEDVDAFDILTDGSIVVSTIGNGNVTGVGGFNDEDLVRCVGTFGPTTTCIWTVYFDGSDVAMTAGSEDIDGVAVVSGRILLSTTGAFSVTGLTGQGEDVFACESPTTGPATACASFTMYSDGSVNGITDNLDAIDVP